MGDVFAGRYELVDPLAEGGSGVVWRAWDRRASTYVAAKVLRQVDSSTLVRFMREQALRVDHPHVLAPTGWAGEDDRVLLTMPLVRGGSVATLLGDHGALPVAWVAELLDQILAALTQIHDLGLVHRDVKPANLLLDATGTGLPRLWLSDFGVATSVDEPRLTQGPYALGTPGYLAPECLTQDWEPHAAADVYAAGMCALEMLGGRRPPSAGGVFSGDAAALLAEALGARDTRAAATLRALVLALTSADPERRPTAARAREVLVGFRLRDGGATDQGDPVEVFDQVPPLPHGWSENGPERDAAAAAPAVGQPAAPEASEVREVPAAPITNVRTPIQPMPLGFAPPDASRTELLPRDAPEPAVAGAREPERAEPFGAAAHPPERRRGGAAPAIVLMLGGVLLIVAAFLARLV